MLLESISNNPSLPCKDYTLFVCLCFQGKGCNKKKKNCTTIRNEHRNCARNKYFKRKQKILANHPVWSQQCFSSSFAVLKTPQRHNSAFGHLVHFLTKILLTHIHTHIYIHIHMETYIYCTIRKFQVPDHNNML